MVISNKKCNELQLKRGKSPAEQAVLLVSFKIAELIRGGERSEGEEDEAEREGIEEEKESPVVCEEKRRRSEGEVKEKQRRSGGEEKEKWR